MRTKPVPDHAARWQRINQAMDRAGLETQADLAKALGVSRATVTGWKAGTFMPNNAGVDVKCVWR